MAKQSSVEDHEGQNPDQNNQTSNSHNPERAGDQTGATGRTERRVATGEMATAGTTAPTARENSKTPDDQADKEDDPLDMIELLRAGSKKSPS
ncbi:hypothetical protein PCASD_21098 [Puccinia coronata f. sp. avenae]|uniref:Uncharacterized protein n=1 Tax=Puccinia coronata f. sp. avenae TaxID=200324 RepID=A0A2N5T252_9BASI|nr:hypothetical protein PCASD_21098 [Puccinia coronata f. sp. avenae]